MTITNHSDNPVDNGMYAHSPLHMLALARVTCLAIREKLLLLEIFDDPEKIFALGKRELEGLVGRKIRVEQFEGMRYLRAAESDERVLATGSIRAIDIFDPGYPAQLAAIHDPPLVLFYRGTLPEFDVPCVGIVGTRNPTGFARTAAFRLAMELSTHGVGIVSGLARGIDFEVHSGSLEGKGISMAVLGNGIDSLYPKSSESLGRKMLDAGGVVFSEYPPFTPPFKFHFPARNRIISGLARCLVIIQAPAKSGALITADYALEQGRELYVHKVGLAGTQGAGTLGLMLEGAKAIGNAGDVISEWGGRVQEGKAFVAKQYRAERVKPGTRLARLVASELRDELVTHNGEISIKGAMV